MGLGDMGFFEWAVLVLLACIWLRSVRPESTRAFRQVSASLPHIEVMLATIHNTMGSLVANSDASVRELEAISNRSLSAGDPLDPM